MIAGSFLATLVLRWPQGKGIIHGRSMCDQCGCDLSAIDLVPLGSWIVSRGRCRTCGARIDPVHPAIEGLCGLTGAAALVISPGSGGIVGALFGWVLVALAALDLRHFWLPDRLVLALLAISTAGWWLDLDPSGPDRLLGALGGYSALALVAGLYRLLREREGLGGGDAKLFGAIGAMLGWQPLPLVLVGACSLGLVFVLMQLVTGGRVRATDRLPLGALLAFSAFIAWILAQ